MLIEKIAEYGSILLEEIKFFKIQAVPYFAVSPSHNYKFKVIIL